MPEPKSTMQVDVALVRQLAELLDETQLSEIEVEDGGRKIRVARGGGGGPVQYAPPPAAAPLPAPTASLPAETPPAATSESGTPAKSPMVGTAFLSSEPGAAPFVSVGDKVKEGQTILIIEAMKVMNAIPAPRAGKVTRVCVENGQPVEFDQTLVIIE